MLYITIVLRNEEYKLRLTTKNIVDLERKLKCNPLSVLFDIYSNIDENDTEEANFTRMLAHWSVEKFVLILHASLQKYHHDMTLDKVYDLYDDMLSENFDMGQQMDLLAKIFQSSGLMPKEKSEDKEDDEKNV